MLGLELADIYSVLSSYTGSEYVNDFTKFGRIYQVTMAGEKSSRNTVDDVLRLSVKNNRGDMVPFSSFMTTKLTSGSSGINRYNMYQTASLTATPACTVSAHPLLSV